MVSPNRNKINLVFFLKLISDDERYDKLAAVHRRCLELKYKPDVQTSWYSSLKCKLFNNQQDEGTTVTFSHVRP